MTDLDVPPKASAAASAEAEPPRPPRLPPLGVIGWTRWAWRQLTSMRIALILLFLLAVAAIPGSVLPQRTVDPIQVDRYFRDHPDLAPALDRLYLFDVFAGPWFAAIYLLLFISLVGCVLPRAARHWAAVRASPPRTPRNFDRLPAHREWVSATPPDAVLGTARRALRGYRVEVSGGSLRAEKGFVRETGNLLFHVALVGLLVAFALGKLAGYRGSVLVVEGEGFANTLTQYDTFSAGRFYDAAALAPFSLTLDDFTADYDPATGAPRDFAAEVSYKSDPDAAASAAQIRVNHPLEVGGAKLFLGARGYAAVVTVRDGAGEVAFQQAVPFLPYDPRNLGSQGVIKVPDAVPTQLGFQAYLLPTAAFDAELGPVSTFPAATDPRLVLSAWTGDLGLDTGIPQSVYRLETGGMTQVADGAQPWTAAVSPGESAHLPGGLGSVTFDGVQEWVELDIVHDPGTTPALMAAALALLGLVLTLFIRRRRVWVRARADGDGRTVVELGALAPTDVAALDDEVDRIVDRIQDRLRDGDGQ